MFHVGLAPTAHHQPVVTSITPKAPSTCSDIELTCRKDLSENHKADSADLVSVYFLKSACVHKHILKKMVLIKQAYKDKIKSNLLDASLMTVYNWSRTPLQDC